MKKIYTTLLFIFFAAFIYGQTVWGDVEPIFQTNCVSCHGNAGGLMINYQNLVNVPSNELPSMDRIEPFSPPTSYLFLKITNMQGSVGGSGTMMPPTGSLIPADIATITTWIAEGALMTVGIDDNDEAFNSHKLFQNYPNPIVNSTMIEFFINSETSVELSVFDMSGKVVRTLERANLKRGIHQFSWMANDEAGNRVENGLYIIRLNTDQTTQTIKACVLR
ncbi:T9SS type A sorting domain-containing protein [Bacteroidota bacterium]